MEKILIISFLSLFCWDFIYCSNMFNCVLTIEGVTFTTEEIRCNKVSNSNPLELNSVEDISGVKKFLMKNSTIDVLPAGTFEVLTGARVIDLSANKLEKVLAGTFGELKSLEELNLSENLIQIVEDNALSSLSNLKRLFLQKNYLKLDNEPFKGLTNLEFLDLSTNRIQELSVSVFSDLEKLENLSLSSNLLTTIPAGAFDNVKSLKNLDLSVNLLSRLEVSVFSSLSSLEDLYLYENNLTVLEKDLFKNLVNLRTVEFYSNPLVEIQDVGFGSKVVSIFGSQTKLINFNTNLSHTSLENFDLSDGCLEEFDFSIFRNLNSISDFKPEVINLARNRISILKNFGDLEAGLVFLENNSIAQIDELPAHVVSLRLSENEIKEIPLTSKSVNYSLEYLYLDYNRIESVSDLYLPKLKSIDLSDNQIHTIKKYSFASCGSLEYIELVGNKIEHIEPDVFNGASSVMMVTLSRNRLSNIEPGTFSGLNGMITLNINDNQINSIDLDSIVQDVPNLSTLLVKNNPLYCDELDDFFRKARWYHITVSTDVGFPDYNECVERRAS